MQEEHPSIDPTTQPDSVRQVLPTSDTVGHSPSLADSDGHRRTVSDTVGHLSARPEIPEGSRLLNTAEIVQKFVQAGVPRSQRSIERYADKGKMICTKDLKDQWWCTEESADILIIEERQFQERATSRQEPTGATEPVGHEPAPQEPSRQVEDETSSSSAGDLSKRELQAKVGRLEFELEVNKKVIERYEAERLATMDKFAEWGQKVGALENQLHQLEAPRQRSDSQRQQPTTQSPTETRDAEYSVTGEEPGVEPGQGQMGTDETSASVY